MTSIVISRADLPERPLLDTGILIRALREYTDAHTETCVAFLKALLDENKDILIAAPTLAEVVRGNAATTLPAVAGITVVGFDKQAAEILGKGLPAPVLKEEAAQAGKTGMQIKYDAMIAACAARHRADVVVTLDDDMAKLAARLRVAVARPADYLSKVLSLPLEPRGRGTPRAD
ncbi:MAG: hypothetical protein A2138_22525 [Deltaproteobacteria bacterium RBG_16_71_12]|nr:MAG: hypothetical protein A2138_22525 [Deltaproteobacteria bacterium RBG_16_71_12]